LADPIVDSPQLRTELNKLWQKACVDTIDRGMPATAVFETMFIVGVAGLIEVQGKINSARRLSAVAQQLLEQAQQEVEALEESEKAVKN
jgi:hypothetical protein